MMLYTITFRHLFHLLRQLYTASDQPHDWPQDPNLNSYTRGKDDHVTASEAWTLSQRFGELFEIVPPI